MNNIKEKKLTIKEEIFCVEFIKGTKKSDCYRIAYKPPGSLHGSVIAKRAAEIFSRPHVQKYIQELKAPVIKKNLIEINDVLSKWVQIATADPNDLIQHRRLCCRYCYGVDHKYQYTIREYEKQKENASFEEKGGHGYNGTKEPHANCPECFGIGVSIIYVADTRKLKGNAKALYAGIKQNSSGAIEILMRNQDAALENIAKFLGMFKITLGGSGEGTPPIPIEFGKMVDPIQAAQAYQQFITGK